VDSFGAVPVTAQLQHMACSWDGFWGGEMGSLLEALHAKEGFLLIYLKFIFTFYVTDVANEFCRYSKPSDPDACDRLLVLVNLMAIYVINDLA